MFFSMNSHPPTNQKWGRTGVFFSMKASSNQPEVGRTGVFSLDESLPPTNQKWGGLACSSR